MVKTAPQHTNQGSFADSLREWSGGWGQILSNVAWYSFAGFIAGSAITAWTGGDFRFWGTLAVGLVLGTLMALQEGGYLRLDLGERDYSRLRKHAAVRRRWTKTMGELGRRLRSALRTRN